MKIVTNWVVAAALGAALALGATSARAQVNPREPDPAKWLRQVYALYLRAEKAPALRAQASYQLIVKRASKTLDALFKKDEACEAKNEGICAIDWDFVIDGQISELSDIKVGPLVVAGDRGSVTVNFNNSGPNVNVYEFVRENGQWKVDDVVTKTGTDAPSSLAALIRDFKS